MENFVYQAVMHYFKALSLLGYYKYKDVEKLIVLLFYHVLIDHDYRGYVKEKDYKLIDKALHCLYGTTCLIPYPDYLKMGKLKLGEFTEVLSRTKAIEKSNEMLQQQIYDNDALISDTIRRVDEMKGMPQDVGNTLVVKSKNYVTEIPDIDVTEMDDIPER